MRARAPTTHMRVGEGLHNTLCEKTVAYRRKRTFCIFLRAYHLKGTSGKQSLRKGDAVIDRLKSKLYHVV